MTTIFHYPPGWVKAARGRNLERMRAKIADAKGEKRKLLERLYKRAELKREKETGDDAR